MTSETAQPENDGPNSLKDIMGFHFDGKTGEEAKQAFLEDWGMPRGLAGFAIPVTIEDFVWDPNWAPPFPEDAQNPAGFLAFARRLRVRGRDWTTSLLECDLEREAGLDLDFMKANLHECFESFSPILSGGFEGLELTPLYSGQPWTDDEYQRILRVHQNVTASLGYSKLSRLLDWYDYIPRSLFHDMYLRHFLLELVDHLYAPEDQRVEILRGKIKQLSALSRASDRPLSEIQQACCWVALTLHGAVFAVLGYPEVGGILAQEPDEDQQRMIDHEYGPFVDPCLESAVLSIARALKTFDSQISRTDRSRQHKIEQESDTSEYSYRKSGSVWEVAFQGNPPFHIADNLGAKYVDWLLHHPGEVISCVDLEAEATPEKAGLRLDTRRAPNIDPIAQRQAYNRLKELSAERAKCDEQGSAVDLAEIDEEVAQISAYLCRGNRSQGDKERARDAIRKPIERLIKKLDHGERVEKNFAIYLKARIKAGYDIMFIPDLEADWK